VRFAAVGPERAAVRHFFRGGLAGRVVRDLFLGGERAFREVRLYERARRAGVPTLEPLGAAARRAGPFLWRFDLVTRAVDNARDLASLWFEGGLGAAGPARRAAVLRAAAAAVRALHDAGIEHADLNLKNVLVVGSADTAPRALVIDLDRARERAGPLDPGRRIENLLRLWRSALKIGRRAGPEPGRGAGGPPRPREALRFARAYFGRDREELRRAARAFRAYAPRLAAHRALWGRA
jgi:3-deoxy-D-manno-octulosonic acid kinase